MTVDDQPDGAGDRAQGRRDAAGEQVRSTVSDDDMPQLFQAADRASRVGQSTYVRGSRFRLVLLCVAAATGVVPLRVGAREVDVASLVAVGLFVLALMMEAVLWRDRPERAWYDGRAVAESAKTLAWKFAVAATPFPATLPLPDATRLLVERLDAVSHQFWTLELEGVDAPVVSEWMRQCRAAPFAERRRVYLEGRVRDQQKWYAAKARYNRRRARQWRTTLVVLEFTGAAVSLVEATTRTGLFVGPLVAAVAGAVVAWLETKQHDSLARAYSAAVRDLAYARQRLELVESEEAWASEVTDAEEAISREHTVWFASRSRA